MDVLNQASTLKNAMSLVPNYLDTVSTQLAQRREEEETKRLAVDTKMKEAEQEDELAYVEEATRVFANPNASEIAKLQARFPKRHSAIKTAWDTKSEAVKSADISNLSNIWGATRSGKWDLAAKWARQRYEAEMQRGEADDTDRVIVDILENGTPEDRATVTGLISHQILGALGPEKFASAYESFSEGEERDTMRPFKVTKAQSDAETATAEADSADEYYTARARSEKAQADTREAESAWVDVKNASQIEVNRARKANIYSVIKKRGSALGKAPGKVTPQDVTDYLSTKGKKSKLTPAELEAWNHFNKAKASSKIKEGQTATNAKGQKIIFQGGEWKILKSSVVKK